MGLAAFVSANIKSNHRTFVLRFFLSFPFVLSYRIAEVRHIVHAVMDGVEWLLRFYNQIATITMQTYIYDADRRLRMKAQVSDIVITSMRLITRAANVPLEGPACSDT